MMTIIQNSTKLKGLFIAHKALLLNYLDAYIITVGKVRTQQHTNSSPVKYGTTSDKTWGAQR